MEGLAETTSPAWGEPIIFYGTRPQLFLDAYADRILDFDPSEGDRIKIDVSEFGYTRLEANVKVVHHSHERTEALLDGANEFVFDTHSGELIWNRNGDVQGYGNGVIAILTGESQTNLTNAHIDLI